MGFARGARGAWARGLAFAVLLFALAGPMLVKETACRPCRTVAVMVTDRSQSMGVGNRAAQAEAARRAVKPPAGAAAQPDRARDQRHHHRHRRE